MDNAAPVRRARIRVTGVVQGVGFRPFVFARATALELTGFVGNDASGVFIEAQGEAESLATLLSDLSTGPPMAQVDDVTWSDLPLDDDDAFRIVESTVSDGTTSIPPDTAVCDDCLTELRDPSDRRFGYAFIACTNCGPRYTIVTGLPSATVTQTVSHTIVTGLPSATVSVTRTIATGLPSATVSVTQSVTKTAIVSTQPNTASPTAPA